MKQFRVLRSLNLPTYFSASADPMSVYWCYNRSYGYYTVARVEYFRGKWSVTLPWGQYLSLNHSQFLDRMNEHNRKVREAADPETPDYMVFGPTSPGDTHYIPEGI